MLVRRLTMLVGLPGSGKTTWAKKYILPVLTGEFSVKRVNKDDLRDMLNAGIYSTANEDFVRAVEVNIVKEALRRGSDVVVDDTNLHKSDEMHWRNIAIECGAHFSRLEIGTPLEICIMRDSKRPHPVGAERITEMHNKFIEEYGRSL